MKKSVRWFVAAGAVAVVVGGFLWALAPRPIEVEVETASIGRFERHVEDDAFTRLRDRFVVSAPLPGVVSRIGLREGDEVAVGSPVATLNPSPPALQDVRTVRELQARLAAAQAHADGARARVEAAETAVVRAQRELARSEQLAEDGFISATRLDGDRLAVTSARAERQAAGHEHLAAIEAVAQARAALMIGPEGARGSTGEKIVLRAPVSGRVVRVAHPSEGAVLAGTTLLEIGDLHQLEVVVELLTVDALQAQPGATVQIDRWGGNEVLQGKVRAIEPGAFTKISALGVEEQRVRVIIDLLSPHERWARLGDGYFVRARVRVREADDVLRVAVGAVFPLPIRDDGDSGEPNGPAWGVFVVDQDRVRLRPVTLVDRNERLAWVDGGLRAGDRVVVYPASGLADGVRIRPRVR